MEGSTLSLEQQDAFMMYENGVETSQNFINHPVLNFRKEYVKIVEQPASKALRFRYECEGRSAGSIPGASSTPENKTYPTIQVVGYEGRAVVVVSCVTKDEPYRPHPHNLVGREGCKKGVCTLEIPPETMTVCFSNLGIQCVKKKDIEMSLKTREEIRVDPFRTGFNHRNHPLSIDLNAVRLCFQVFLEGDKKGKFTVPLTPIVSEPIFDKKSSADLVIVKLSDCNSYVDGGRKDIILLCEKVAKEDIQIRFFEEKDGLVIWESFGDFQPSQVHKQTAIWFKTPRYKTLEITEPVKAFIQLRRPSDGATSEALPFEFLPLDAGRPSYWSLGKSFMKKGNYNLFSNLLCDANINAMIEKQTERNIVTQEEDLNEKETPQKSDIDEMNITEIAVTELALGNKIADRVEPNNNEVDLNKSILEENENLEEKSFNQLIDEVAELDELYSTTHESKNFTMEENPDQKNTQFDDSKTYSSLQLAFKNPMNITYKPIEEKPQNTFFMITEETYLDKNSNKRDSPVETLPPLPPKRQRKIETYIGDDERLKEALLHPKPVKINRSHSFNSGQLKKEDSKYLGSTSTIPNPKKSGFFSKLFGRKNKNKTSENISKEGSYSSATSLQMLSSAQNKSNGNKESDGTTVSPVVDVELVNSIQRRSVVSSGETASADMEEDKLNTSLDLTEAEHYALYTLMAPHATQSEFDEMSCYYAAVEGGKILS